PLPPLPLHFSTTSLGRNIKCVKKGSGAQWTSHLHLGRCGLASPVRKGDSVVVEVTGTGYFTVDVRTKQLSVQQLQLTSEGVGLDALLQTVHVVLVGWSVRLVSSTGKPPSSQSLCEVKFKLKKSKFSITFERTSRSLLHIVSTNTEGLSNTYDVGVPSGVDPWPTFNVLFGLLSIISIASGKNKKPWPFQTSHGLNITIKSRFELASSLYNPCALVVTERAVSPGETAAFAVEPESKDCQSSVKIYLTNSSPSAITLQANRVYFDTQRGVYSSLHFACEVKRFHGVLKLRINTEAGQLEIKQADDSKEESPPCTQCIRLMKVPPHNLDLTVPVYLCMELFRVHVGIVQADSFPQGYTASYALTAAEQPRHDQVMAPQGHPTRDDSDYLTPVPDTGFPDLPNRAMRSLSSCRVSTIAMVHLPPHGANDLRRSDTRHKHAGQQAATNKTLAAYDDGKYEEPVVNLAVPPAASAKTRKHAQTETETCKDKEKTETHVGLPSEYISHSIAESPIITLTESSSGTPSQVHAIETDDIQCPGTPAEASVQDVAQRPDGVRSSTAEELSPFPADNLTVQRETAEVPGQSDDVQYVRAKLQRLDNVVQALDTVVSDISKKLKTSTACKAVITSSAVARTSPDSVPTSPETSPPSVTGFRSRLQ
ncbi:hypothetical protein BaRGS_00040490, partial [Batillaria attramentaria]